MARKFLYFIAACIVFVLAIGITWQIFGDRIARVALVPGAPFKTQPPMAMNAWADPKMWFARPGVANDPSRWAPAGYRDPAAKGDAAIFFVHPTSFIDRGQWNAALDDATANDRALIFIRGQASALASAGDVWAPRYRQATFGAFLTDQAEGQRALDAAYGDVVSAWQAFLAQIPSDKPIIIAGHSQGALHAIRLLREHVAKQPVSRRIVAAYLVGWPVPMVDVAALGLPACTGPDQARCILSWQSFAEPAETLQIEEALAARSAAAGLPARQRAPFLCSNPLTGGTGGTAPATANLGTVIPSADLRTGTIEVGRVPSRCDDRGFLLIGAPPKGFGIYVLPGNNFHVFDYPLFWANVRVDARTRLAAFKRP
jgi:hypothetical protein